MSEIAVRAKLVADAKVAAIVVADGVERIFAGAAPEGQDTPLIILTRNKTEIELVGGLPAVPSTAIINVLCLTKSFVASQALAKLVMYAVREVDGELLGGVRVDSILLLNMVPDFYPTPDIYSHVVTFAVASNEFE